MKASTTGFRLSRRGFSLAEILVVMVIIAFSSTIALLTYSNYRKDAALRGSAERIRALLIEARTRAIADDRPSAVVFDLDNQVFWLDELESDLSIRRPKAVAPEYLGPEVRIEEIRINSSTFTADRRSVVYQPDGNNPLVTVHLRRSSEQDLTDENFYSIQMYPASAEPRIWPNARK